MEFKRHMQNCDSYSFKQNEVLKDKPKYLGFAILELKKLHLFETYYDKLQPYFRKEHLQLHYVDTDSFVLKTKTENIIKTLKNSEDMFDFSNLNEKHETKTKKILVKLNVKLLKIFGLMTLFV